MSKKCVVLLIAAGLICSSMLYVGCANKNYADQDARPSAGWVTDALIYRVYLRSFSKEGTFKALETRIPELKKLGVTVISLMPIHPVGELNRRGKLGSPYAVKDFTAVNPEFGTMDDFKSLVQAVHREEMKIIIGLAADRAAWDSPMLMEHPDWFMHNEEGAIVSPHPDWSEVAGIDYRQHEPRKYMLSMMKSWVKDAGIDGFSCALSDLIPTDFWDIARKELEKIKPVIMISESPLPEHHLAAFDLSISWNVYHALASFADAHVRLSSIDDSLAAERSQFPKGSLRLNFTTTPEKNMEEGSTVERCSAAGAKAAAVLTYTFPGIPYLYNGEEAGSSSRLDLFNKTEIDWSKGSEMRPLYEALGAQRIAHPAIRSGSYARVSNSDSARVFSYFRTSGKDSVLIVISAAHEKREIQLRLPPQSSRTWKEVFTQSAFQMKDAELSVSLGPFGYVLLVPALQKEKP